MSYTVKIKEEISKIDSSKTELISELSGYIRNNASKIFSYSDSTNTYKEIVTICRGI